MTLPEITGHICYILILLSFMVRDMERLRSLSIAASTLSIYYSLYGSDRILWPPLFWSVVFIMINSWQLFVLLRAKRVLKLSPEEQWLIEGPLPVLSHSELKALYQRAVKRKIDREEPLLQSGQDVESLFLVRKGGARIKKSGEQIATAAEGDFLGEMSFLAGGKARADVVIEAGSELWEWKRGQIDAWQQSDLQRKVKLQSAIGAQLVRSVLKEGRS